jgi:hypothetical protein
MISKGVFHVPVCFLGADALKLLAQGVLDNACYHVVVENTGLFGSRHEAAVG